MADPPTSPPDGRAFNLWWSFIAGDRVWLDDDDPQVRTRLAGAVEALAFLAVTTSVWSTALERRETDDGPLFLVAAAITTIAVGCFVIRPVEAALGRPTAPVRFRWRLVWRLAAALVIVAGVVLSLPGWHALAAWPLGVAIGADVIASAWALGIEVEPLRWCSRFVTSPVHLGVVGAIVAVLLRGADDGLAFDLVGLYVALILAAAAAAAVIALLDRLDRDHAADLDEMRRDVAAAERRLRSHWLHDDVLSEVRIATLRVQAAADVDVAAQELLDLDHRLRLRQLDELFGRGTVRLADIVQPHVRRLQSLGVVVVEVPSLDTMGHETDTATGRLFERAVSVLTSNAVNAGARRIGIVAEPRDGSIVVEVTDDAGGFDLTAVDSGRGLRRLWDDLGPDNLWRDDAPGGSTMCARVFEDPDPDHRGPIPSGRVQGHADERGDPAVPHPARR